MHATAGILEMIKGIGFKNKSQQLLGSYGWSGESVAVIEQKLKDAKLENSARRNKRTLESDAEAISRCIEFGRILRKNYRKNNKKFSERTVPKRRKNEK